MAEMKTKPTDASVEAFLASVPDEQRRKDCRALVDLMGKATGEKPRMWGPSMVGFGSYHYKYASGREGDWFVAGFSPRKDSLSIYVLPGLEPYAAIMQRLGKFKAGKSCLYVKKLADVDPKVLRELVAAAAKALGKGRR